MSSDSFHIEAMHFVAMDRCCFLISVRIIDGLTAAYLALDSVHAQSVPFAF